MKATIHNAGTNELVKKYKKNNFKIMGKNYLIMVVLALSYINAAGQNKSETNSPDETTYILPNGKELKNDKMDSLTSAWGKDRVLFRHSEIDDKKGIVHLVRETDEMVKKSKEMDAARELAFTAMINQPAPEFELKDLQGKTWSLKELQGKTVILNFWFTSCAPCIQEIPELNTLVEKYRGKDVVFLGLTYNTPQQVRTFLKKRPFDYTLLPDSKEIDIKYHINSWPASIVIDKNGIIRSILNYSPQIGEELKKTITLLQ